MVSLLSLIAMTITLILSFIVPVLLFIFVRRSSKNVTGAVFAGALSFYLSQMVIRLPLIQVVLPKFEWYSTFAKSTIPFLLFLSLTAGLFEETARYFAFQFLLKEKQVWKCGIAFGIGHGGIEAILLVGVTYINNIVLSIAINTNNFQSFIGDKVDNKMAEYIYSSLVNTSPGLFLSAGIERVLTIGVHIALSVLILEGIVRKRSLYYYGLAVVCHTVLNFTVAYLAYLKVNYWVIELFIALAAAVGLFYVVKSKNRFGGRIEAEDEARKALEEGY